MDGQDPGRGGYSEDPSYTIQQSPYDTPQNRQSNYVHLSGNKLSQSHRRHDPAITSSQPNGSVLQPYGGAYYAGNSSVAGPNALSLAVHQQSNYASAGPSRQHSPQGYYHGQQCSAASSYQAVQQPMLLNPPQYDTSQQYRHPRRPAQLNMLQNDAFAYDLGQDQTELPALPLPPPQVTTSYLLGRASAAHASQPPLVAPAPPQPQQVRPIHQPIDHQQPLLPSVAHMNRSTFEQELEKVYTNLRPIVQTINSDGNLKSALNAMFKTTEDFIEAVEEMRLTLDVPEQEARGYRLWRDINHAWLALLQNQFRRSSDLSEARAQQKDSNLLPRQTIITVMSQLSELAREHLEEQGLLDYEWGLWEADILNAADRCLELL